MAEFKDTLQSKSYQRYLESKNNSYKYGNSSFWMDGLVSRIDDGSKSFDLFKMVQYQRAIANFVKIMSQKDIPVIFSKGEDSMTDGKTKVILSAQIDDKSFDVTTGLALHEASHILRTDFALAERMFPKYQYWPDFVREQSVEIQNNMPFFCKRFPTSLQRSMAKLPAGLDRDYLFKLTNWVEDRRIDFESFLSSPGYKAYYHALYEKYFWNKTITNGLQSAEYRSEDAKSYYFRILGLTNPQTDPKALRGLRDIINTVDLHNIGRLKSTKDAIAIAMRVFDIVIEYCYRAEERKQAELDRQRASQKAKEEKQIKKEEDQAKSDVEPDTESIPSPSDSKDNEEDDEKSDIKGSSKPENESAASDDEKDSGSENDPDNTINKSTDPNESDDSESKSDSEEEDDSYGDASGTDSSDPSDPEESEEETENSGNVSAETDSEEAEQDSTNANSESEDEEEPELERLTDKELAKLNRAFEELESLVEGDVKKSKAKKQVANLANEIGGSKEYDLDTITFNGQNIPVLAVRVSPSILLNEPNGITRKFISSNRLNLIDNKGYDPNSTEGKIIYSGLNLGNLLGRKLQIRDQIRDTKYTRLKSGKIDGRLLYQAGYDVMNIFHKIDIDKYSPNVIDISIDASSSMAGSRWNNTQTAVLAIAKACSMIQNIRVKVSYRYNFKVNSAESAIFVDVYDSKRDTIKHLTNCIYCMHPVDCTSDSLILQYQLSKRLITPGTNDLKSYFINFSDGGPGCVVRLASGTDIHYSGDAAHEHIKKCRKEIEALNVKVLSYFMVSGNANQYSKTASGDSFKDDWGMNNAMFINVTDLLSLAGTMNKMFLSNK